MERTLVLVKPDGVARRLVGEVVGAIEAKGLRLVAMKLTRLTNEVAERHYASLKGKPFYPDLIAFITSGPVVALVAEGPNAIFEWRAMMGATDPAKAAPGTLRQRLALSVQMNLVHGSDSPESAGLEIANLFSPEEFAGGRYPDEHWTFGTEGA